MGFSRVLICDSSFGTGYPERGTGLAGDRCASLPDGWFGRNDRYAMRRIGVSRAGSVPFAATASPFGGSRHPERADGIPPEHSDGVFPAIIADPGRFGPVSGDPCPSATPRLHCRCGDIVPIVALPNRKGAMQPDTPPPNGRPSFAGSSVPPRFVPPVPVPVPPDIPAPGLCAVLRNPAAPAASGRCGAHSAGAAGRFRPLARRISVTSLPPAPAECGTDLRDGIGPAAPCEAESGAAVGHRDGTLRHDPARTVRGGGT